MSGVFCLALWTLLPLFALIGVGYVLRRRAILDHEHVPVLNALVLNVLLPATIVRALLRAPNLTIEVIKLPLALLLGEALVLAILFGIEIRIKRFRSLLGASLLTGTFGNTAFLGYPILQTLLPHQFPSAVIIDEFGMMLALYPVAAVLGSLFGSAHAGQESPLAAIKRFLRSPLFLAIIAGITLRFLPFPLALAHQVWVAPIVKLLDQCTAYLAQATTPVVLIALGLALEPGGGEAPLPMLIGTCGAKLLLLPLVVYGLTLLMGVRGYAQTVLVLQAAMPAGVLSGVLAQQYRMGGKFGVKSVCISTALAAFTIPVVVLLLR